MQLSAQEKSEEIRVIPVVVVDGSTDSTYEMLASEFPAAHVLQGPGNWWWTKSVNEGVKQALTVYNPDQILILNDDSQVKPDYINSLMNASQEAGKNSIIGSISITDKEPYKVSFSGVKKLNWVALKKENYYKSFELLKNISSTGLQPTYALNGRGTLISSIVMQDLGLLNERSFPQYGSDDDLALRAWKKGYNVFISFSCKIYDRADDTSKGTAYRQDSVFVFLKSFFTWHSVNYIPKAVKFFYYHGIKILLPFYILKFLLGTSYAYFFKYKGVKI